MFSPIPWLDTSRSGAGGDIPRYLSASQMKGWVVPTVFVLAPLFLRLSFPGLRGGKARSRDPDWCWQAGSCAGKPLSAWDSLGLGRQMNFLPISSAGGSLGKHFPRGFWGGGKDLAAPLGYPCA